MPHRGDVSGMLGNIRPEQRNGLSCDMRTGGCGRDMSSLCRLKSGSLHSSSQSIGLVID